MRLERKCCCEQGSQREFVGNHPDVGLHRHSAQLCRPATASQTGLAQRPAGGMSVSGDVPCRARTMFHVKHCARAHPAKPAFAALRPSSTWDHAVQRNRKACRRRPLGRQPPCHAPPSLCRWASLLSGATMGITVNAPHSGWSFRIRLQPAENSRSIRFL